VTVVYIVCLVLKLGWGVNGGVVAKEVAAETLRLKMKMSHVSVDLPLPVIFGISFDSRKFLSRRAIQLDQWKNAK